MTTLATKTFTHVSASPRPFETPVYSTMMDFPTRGGKPNYVLDQQALHILLIRVFIPYRRLFTRYFKSLYPTRPERSYPWAAHVCPPYEKFKDWCKQNIRSLTPVERSMMIQFPTVGTLYTGKAIINGYTFTTTVTDNNRTCYTTCGSAFQIHTHYIDNSHIHENNEVGCRDQAERGEEPMNSDCWRYGQVNSYTIRARFLDNLYTIPHTPVHAFS